MCVVRTTSSRPRYDSFTVWFAVHAGSISPRALRDRSLHFEDVGEIRRVEEQQRHLGVAVAEVGERQLLVPAAAPQQAIALDVDHAFRDRQLAGRGQRPVGEMRGEQRVVAIDRGAEQRGAPARDAELEARQHARVVREQPVVRCLDVAQRVGEQEGIAVLEREARQQAAPFTGFVGGAHASLVEASGRAQQRCGCVSRRAYRST